MIKKDAYREKIVRGYTPTAKASYLKYYKIGLIKLSLFRCFSLYSDFVISS